MTKKDHNIRAIADAEVAAGTSGWISYWTLTESVFDTVLEAAAEAGLDEAEWPVPPSDKAAFRRALGTLEERHQLIRRLPGGKFAIVNEAIALPAETSTPADDGSEEATPTASYSHGVTVWLDGNGVAKCQPANAPAGEAIAVAYEHARTTLAANDVSSWLTSLCRASFAGVSLRQMGGIYFVPPGVAEAWKRVADAVNKGTSCHVYCIPAMRSEDTVAAVLDAVIADAQAACEEMEQVLTGEHQARAYRNRADACKLVLARLEAYDGMLGDRLAAIRGRVSQLDADLTVAALAAAA